MYAWGHLLMMSGDQSYMKNFLFFAICLPLLINDLSGEKKEDENEDGADGVEEEVKEEGEEDDIDDKGRESTTEAVLI